MAANASQRLHEIGARCRAEGLRGPRLEMTRAIRTGAQPLIRAAEAEARRRLPKEGGLNELVAARHTTVSVLTGARTAGVRLKRARKDAASYQTNRGYIWHRTWGEKPWKRLELPQGAGWWDDPMRAGSPAITPLIVREMERTANRITFGGV